MHAMGVATLDLGRHGEVARMVVRGGTLGVAEFLLGDGTDVQLNRGAVVTVRVIERALAGREEDVHDFHQIVFQHDLVVRLLIDGNRLFLGERHCNQDKEQTGNPAHAHGYPNRSRRGCGDAV